MKNKNLIFLILFLSLLAAFLISRAIFLKPQKELELLTTTPKTNQENVSLDQIITLTFNQAISEKNLIVFTYPNFQYQLEKKEKSLIVKPKGNLAPDTKYNIEIKGQDNSFYFNLIFFTKSKPTILSPTPTANINEGKGDPDADENMAKEILENYPLFDKTPHQDKNWTADYLKPQKLIIVYKKGTNLSLIKEEVFNWIRENDVDPETHIYVWEERETLP